MHRVLLLLTAVSSAAGQIQLTELVTTGDGSEAYFRAVLPLKNEPAEPATVPGRIFRIRPEGFELYLQRSRVDPAPAPSPVLRFTNYFDLIRATASRDGRIVAIVGARDCAGGSLCTTANQWQTTVTGLSGGHLEVEGAGSLSGNGRYLLVSRGRLPRTCSFVLDLQSQSTTPCTAPAPFPYTQVSRAIADNGTAIISAGSLHLIQGMETRALPILSGAEDAVIDAAGSIVVYSLQNWSSLGRSIHLCRLAEQRQTVLVSMPDADSYSPVLSADGRRVMFLSTASGSPQIHTVATTGEEPPRQVTNDESGVLSATMSDDGKVGWYFSGSGRLYSVDIETGETRERLGRTPQIGLKPAMSPGSLATFSGAGFSDTVHRVRVFPLPRSLGDVSLKVDGTDAPLVLVSPTEILLQAPIALRGVSAQLNIRDESPFRPLLSVAPLWPFSGGSFFPNRQSPSAYGGWDALAIHEDWSALVTEQNPARPGEVVHLYGTGFGRVDSPPADGDPAPANPPARTLVPVTCWASGADIGTQLNIPALYSGLSPGLAGVYQLDVQLPASNLRPSTQISCTGEASVGEFYGSFFVRP